MNIGFTTIARGTDSGYQSATKTVVDNSEQWSELWQQHTYNTEPPPTVPQVDFTSYSVVAVFTGEQPTGGHSVEILSVETSVSQTQEQLAIYRSVSPA